MSRFSLLGSGRGLPDASIGMGGFDVPRGPTMADGMIAGAGALGEGIQRAGQQQEYDERRAAAEAERAANLAEQQRAAERRRHITKSNTELITAGRLALEESQNVDTVDDAQAIVDKHFAPLKDQIDSLEDEDAKLALQNDWEQRYTSVRESARARAFNRGVQQFGVDVERQENSLIEQAGTGLIPIQEAVATHEELLARHAADFGPEATEKIRRSFAQRLASARYTSMEPAEARAFLQTDFAKSALTPERRKVMLEQSIIDERRQLQEDTIQTNQYWSNALNLALTDPGTSHEQLADMVHNAAADMSGLSIDPESGVVHTDANDAALRFLIPHLEATSKAGDTEAFNRAAKLLPKTPQASEAEAIGRNTLKTTAAIRAGRDEFDALEQQEIYKAALIMQQGGQPLIDDVEITRSDGQSKTISRERLVKAGTAMGMAAIFKQSATDEEGILRGAQFLSDNGTTYEPWSLMMEAGARTAFSRMAPAKPGDPAPTPPDNLIKGYELYKRIGVFNPIVRNDHLKDAAAKRFYEIAELQEGTQAEGDPKKALALAMVAMGRISQFGDPSLSEVGNKALAAKVQELTEPDNSWLPFGWGETTANNSWEMRAKLEQHAKAYMLTAPIGPEQAVEFAAKKLAESHAIVNNWAVDISNSHAPPNLDALARVAIDKYIAANPGEGVEADDITLIPAQTGATWMLVNKNGGPVDNFRDWIMSRSDLIRLGQANREALEKKIAEAQNNPINFTDKRRVGRYVDWFAEAP